MEGTLTYILMGFYLLTAVSLAMAACEGSHNHPLLIGTQSQTDRKLRRVRPSGREARDQSSSPTWPSQKFCLEPYGTQV